MSGRLRWWLAGSAVLLAALVALGGWFAIKVRSSQLALQAWTAKPEDHTPWATALADGSTSHQISRPAPDTIQVEFQQDAAEAGFYAAAIRERDADVAAFTYGTWVAARSAGIDGDGVTHAEREVELGNEAVLLMGQGTWALIARRGRDIQVISGSGIPAAPTAAAAAILDQRWKAMQTDR